MFLGPSSPVLLMKSFVRFISYQDHSTYEAKRNYHKLNGALICDLSTFGRWFSDGTHDTRSIYSADYRLIKAAATFLTK